MSEIILTHPAVGRQPNMRSRLLIAAAQLFIKKGYSGASLSEIAAACNIKKSSLFHHFVSKEAIALETISMVKKYCEEHIFRPAMNISLTPEQRNQRFLEGSKHFFCERMDNALVGFLGIALVDVADAFNAPVKQYFDAWQTAVVNLIKDRCSPERAYALATGVVAQLQGSLLMWRVYQEPRFIDEAYEQLVKIINQPQ